MQSVQLLKSAGYGLRLLLTSQWRFLRQDSGHSLLLRFTIPLPMTDRETVCWYPMYSTYGSELKVKAELERLGIECFVPMKYALVAHGSERRRVQVPAIHNLIFVRESREKITGLKMHNRVCTHLQYMVFNNLNSTKDIIIVPDDKMKNFMMVASQISDQTVYLRYEDFLDKPGRKVKVIDGVFAGVEGIVKRIKKRRVVVVLLEGIAAVAITELPSEYLELAD